MFNTAGLLAIVLTAERYSAAALRRIALNAALLVTLVPLGYAVFVTFDAHRSSGASLRVNWPQSTIAERLGTLWARDTGQPLRIVAGNPWSGCKAGAKSSRSNRPALDASSRGRRA